MIDNVYGMALIGFFVLCFIGFLWIVRVKGGISVLLDEKERVDSFLDHYVIPFNVNNAVAIEKYMKDIIEKNTKVSTKEAKTNLMNYAMSVVPLINPLNSDLQYFSYLQSKGIISPIKFKKVMQAKDIVQNEMQKIMFFGEKLEVGWGRKVIPQAQRFIAMQQQKAQQQMKANAQAKEAKIAKSKKKKLADKIRRELIEDEEREAAAATKKKTKSKK